MFNKKYIHIKRDTHINVSLIFIPSFDIGLANCVS